jgi:hypothetical protein
MTGTRPTSAVCQCLILDMSRHVTTVVPLQLFVLVLLHVTTGGIVTPSSSIALDSIMFLLKLLLIIITTSEAIGSTDRFCRWIHRGFHSCYWQCPSVDPQTAAAVAPVTPWNSSLLRATGPNTREAVEQ